MKLLKRLSLSLLPHLTFFFYMTPPYTITLAKDSCNEIDEAAHTETSFSNFFPSAEHHTFPQGDIFIKIDCVSAIIV
jgi:hypothetical protein